MDEEIRDLRDLFLDVAGEPTVIERQAAPRGTLGTDESVDDRVTALIESMRDRYDFRTELADSALLTVARGAVAGRADADIAESIEGEPRPEAVAEARIDLHLVTDADRAAPFDLGTLHEALEAGRPIDAIADELGVDEATVAQYRHVVEVDRQRRAVNDRYRSEFERLLADRDLSERLTRDARETGLEDATEGMESNVSF